MKKIVLYIVILLIVPPTMVKGQDRTGGTEEILGKLFERLNDNYNDTSRIQINDSIRLYVDHYVRSDSVFSYKFDYLRHLGQITSPDSMIKIITWNLVLGSGPGRYYCYFIRKDTSGRNNKVYALTSSYKEKPVMTDTTYNASDWYGALYYDLKPLTTYRRQSWVLLGIDYGNPMISRKIIDVLTFSSDGSLVFGRKWFESDKKLSYRVVFEYSAEATMTLRFSSARSIIFDHLVPFNLARTGDKQYYGPDYSNDSYNFENGIWKFSLNVDARNNQ